MNRKQYFAVGWFFFILQFFLMWFQSNFLGPNLFIFEELLTPGAYYQLTKSAIVSCMIILCFPLFILFQILGYYEKK